MYYRGENRYLEKSTCTGKEICKEKVRGENRNQDTQRSEMEGAREREQEMIAFEQAFTS